MAGLVVIGCADQSVAYELRAQLAEAADVEVVGVAETTTELAALVLAHEPNLVLVHDQLGPEPVHQVVRDLGLRRPATVAVVVSEDAEPQALAAAMDAGARGVLTYPLSFEDVQQRVSSALDWSRHLQSMLLAAKDAGEGTRGRATVVAFAGSKGGVGTTSIATHLCWDVRREVPGLKVLVIDLDLEKGDVTSLIEARYRTSIADLAKVSQDLSPRTVVDAVFEHESGLHLLLPPEDVRDVEWVTPAAVRQIIGLVRQQYDLVVVDTGSHVTPVQAAVIEIADEVVTVVTPDLISLRAARRNVGWWESLGVRKASGSRVLLNKHSRRDEVQPDTVRKLAPSPLLDTVLPDLGRKLVESANARSPQLVEETVWWRALRGVGREVGVARAAVVADQGAAEESTEGTEARTAGRRAQRSGRGQAEPQPAAAAGVAPVRGRRAIRLPHRGDEGSASIELLGVLPWMVLACVLLWQLGVAGMTYVWTGYAASDAARVAAIDPTRPDEVRQAAEDRFPDGMRDQLTVAVGSADPGSTTVSVKARVPLMVPGVFATPWDVTVDRQVVSEP